LEPVCCFCSCGTRPDGERCVEVQPCLHSMHQGCAREAEEHEILLLSCRPCRGAAVSYGVATQRQEAEVGRCWVCDSYGTGALSLRCGHSLHARCGRAWTSGGYPDRDCTDCMGAIRGLSRNPGAGGAIGGGSGGQPRGERVTPDEAVGTMRGGQPRGGFVGTPNSALICYLLNSCARESILPPEAFHTDDQEMVRAWGRQTIALFADAEPMGTWVAQRAVNGTWPGGFYGSAALQQLIMGQLQTWLTTRWGLAPAEVAEQCWELLDMEWPEAAELVENFFLILDQLGEGVTSRARNGAAMVGAPVGRPGGAPTEGGGGRAAHSFMPLLRSAPGLWRRGTAQATVWTNCSPRMWEGTGRRRGGPGGDTGPGRGRGGRRGRAGRPYRRPGRGENTASGATGDTARRYLDE
jgi:hypothetical protein